MVGRANHRRSVRILIPCGWPPALIDVILTYIIFFYNGRSVNRRFTARWLEVQQVQHATTAHLINKASVIYIFSKQMTGSFRYGFNHDGVKSTLGLAGEHFCTNVWLGQKFKFLKKGGGEWNIFPTTEPIWYLKSNSVVYRVQEKTKPAIRYEFSSYPTYATPVLL